MSRKTSVLSRLALTVTLVLHHAQGFQVFQPIKNLRRQQPCVSRLKSSNSDHGELPERRSFIQTGALAFSTLLLGGSPALAENRPKTIVLTGGSSGLGFEAVKKLVAAGNTLVLPCRTMQKSLDTIERLESNSGTLIAAECDLASLESVRSFAKELPSLIGNTKIDVLALNAGLSRNTAASDVARTVEGFELTVGTNHFGHFALNKELLPMINPNGGRIVVTASEVHDPKSPGGKQGEKATLGDLTGLERDGRYFEMVDGQSFNADKAYKDSKLCNVMFTRELQRRLDANPATKGIVANSFSPGLIVSTGLFRDQNPLFTKLFDFAATDLLKVGETPDYGGRCLEYVTQVDTKGEYYCSAPGSSKYGEAAFGNQFNIKQVSEEGRDERKAKRLWELSEKLIQG